MNLRNPQAGDINKRVPAMIEAYLKERGLTSGNVEVLSTRLYADLINFLSGQGLNAFPNIRAAGRAFVARLPFRRGRRGTYYLVSAAV